MKCTDCKFCYEVDYGYSNYTVEGTTVYCLMGANPNFPKDRWYGEEPELEFANQCSFFVEGDSVKRYVEESDEDLLGGLDQEMKALMIEFFSLENDGCKGEQNGL